LAIRIFDYKGEIRNPIRVRAESRGGKGDDTLLGGEGRVSFLAHSKLRYESPLGYFWDREQGGGEEMRKGGGHNAGRRS